MTTPFPQLDFCIRRERLKPPTGSVDMVLDTDTDNELDDQFALTYAVLAADRLRLHAVYAAPYANSRSTGPADGMERSHAEIGRVLARLNEPAEGRVFRGSARYLPGPCEPVESPAARDLVRRAMERPQQDPPLYVAAIGAVTNVASALLMEPAIVERVVVVWLGGQPFNWHSAAEFNLQQDLHASRILFDSGVPLVHIPCKNVAEHLRVTRPEIDRFVAPCGPIGAYLQSIYADQASDAPGASRVIWDISAIAWLLDAANVPSALMPAPILTDQLTWSMDWHRHMVRCATDVNRDAVFGDLYARLAARA